MVSILTDFYNLDSSYSIARCVVNQIKMLTREGYPVRLIVRDNFNAMLKARELGANVYAVNPGEIGSNAVNVTDSSELEIQSLTEQLENVLDDTVITHDLIFQANQWKYHVACHRLQKDRRWFHFVHSCGSGSFRGCGKYRKELRKKIPNSKLVVFHQEEFNRKSAAFGYESDNVLIVPNAIDFLEEMHDVTRKIALDFGLMQADIIAVYPARLDRGKQPHKIIDVFEWLVRRGYDARIVFVDFASVSGDKATYRDEMKRQAQAKNVPVFFTSDLEGGPDGTPFNYCVPHQVVMELFEIGDILVHPSRSESDPLILQEAVWKRCGLVLNFDLPFFRLYDAYGTMARFSSDIDVLTGNAGFTNTPESGSYYRKLANAVAYQVEHNPVLKLHQEARKERSLEGVSKKLISALGI